MADTVRDDWISVVVFERPSVRVIFMRPLVARVNDIIGVPRNVACGVRVRSLTLITIRDIFPCAKYALW